MFANMSPHTSSSCSLTYSLDCCLVHLKENMHKIQLLRLQVLVFMFYIHVSLTNWEVEVFVWVGCVCGR